MPSSAWTTRKLLRLVTEGLTIGLVVSGDVDLKKALDRIVKQQDEQEKEIGRLKGKLSNQEFVAKAPPEVIADHQTRLHSLRNDQVMLASSEQQLRASKTATEPSTVHNIDVLLDGEHHMSDVFRWYLGGQMATAAEFALLVAPTVNSYRRFLPGSWAPTAIGWAVDNRTLGFRVVGHGQGMRVENRIPGADANPYHAFAATLAGGLYGIANRIEPPAPYDGDGYAATDLARIPSSFAEAIERWRASTIARECFGDDVHHHVLHFAETELAAFGATVTDWERRRYFERI